MKIAIVGCGRNVAGHLEAAKLYPGACVVGVVDRDRNRAQAAADSFAVSAAYTSLHELLEQTPIDVLHVNTPPRTHAAIARRALDARCAVLIETPLTLNARDAELLYARASEQSVLLSPVHRDQYARCMLQARELVEQKLAGEIVNAEVYSSVSPETPAFREYPAPNVLPWIYSLPGGVYQNFLAQPLSVLLPFTGRPRELSVMKSSHGILLRGLPDEIRVLIRGERGLGSLTLSFAAQPRLHFLRLYGSRMTIEADFHTMTMVSHSRTRLPLALQKAFYNLSEGAHRATQTISNAVDAVRGKLRQNQGLTNMIHAFYNAVSRNAALPVSPDDALLVLNATDEITKQLRTPRLSFAPIVPSAVIREPRPKKVLVTGGAGFVGGAIVRALLQAGYAVRVLAGKLSNIEPLKQKGVEIYFGDAADKASLARAISGNTSVVHAVDASGGTERECELEAVQGARNLLDLCIQTHAEKLIFISTCDVYGTAEYRPGQQVTEASALERFPQKRIPSVRAKIAAERLMRWAMEQGQVPICILRPGLIYGPGAVLVPPAVGRTIANKVFVMTGPRDSVLPLVYVDNLGNAVSKAMNSERANNQIFNVIDNEPVTRSAYVRRILKKVHPRAVMFFCPAGILGAAAAVQDLAGRLFNNAPAATRYELIATRQTVRIDAAKIRETLHWSPVVRFEQAAVAVTSERPETPERQSTANPRIRPEASASLSIDALSLEKKDLNRR